MGEDSIDPLAFTIDDEDSRTEGRMLLGADSHHLRYHDIREELLLDEGTVIT